MSSNIEIQRICEYCEKQFTARTTVTLFCSKKCNSRAYKARVKALKIQASDKETLKIKSKPIEDLKAKEFLTVGEVAKLLNCSKRTAYYYIQAGTINAVNIGQRMTRVKRSDIDHLFVKQDQQKTSHPPQIAYKDEILIKDQYTTKEVREKYKLSEGALQTLLTRNNIQKTRKGWFAYVPKEPIDKIFNTPAKSLR
ncbi:MAG: helix-turn-helix domain-containing protein [Saprospiraceae bacterium]|nr:helix-turn-helix domain-containing protein [Saprospiraceae bacterium]